jgi:hypothetical protein
MSDEDQDYNQFFHGYRAPAPVYNPPNLSEGNDQEPISAVEARKSLEYEKDIKQLQQEVSQLKEALKAIMDLLSKHGASNHPLY